MNAVEAVRTAGLVRTFGHFRALDGVDVEVEPGGVILLAGENGAGKTTFLRVLAGLTPSNGGECELFGRPVKERAVSTLRRIGFLSHSLALYPDLTARENLRFFAALYGVRESGKRIETVLIEVNLGRWGDETVRTFSRGMKQRLALARAFLHEPALLLLDEPFTGLDHDSADALASRIRSEGEGGTTVLMASHRIDVAAPVAGRALILERGSVRQRVDLGGIDRRSRASAVLAALEGGS